MTNMPPDPFTGVWRFVPEKSTLASPAPDSWVQEVRIQGDRIFVRETLSRPGGAPSIVQTEGRLDGGDYPVSGSPGADTMSYVRTGSHTIAGVGRMKGADTLVETISLAADGSSYTLEFAVKLGCFRTNGIAVFERVRLSEVWAGMVDALDYESHMAAVGQAEANAELVTRLLRTRPPGAGSIVWFPGSGPGQMFDYLDTALLAPYRVTFADVNRAFLDRLRVRIEGRVASFETIVDDIEQSRISGPFELIVVVLVLEHVAWRAAVSGLVRAGRRIFVVIQQDPESGTASKALPGSMDLLRSYATRLLLREDLIQEFESHGFHLGHEEIREVLDGKRMVALEFAKD